MWPRAARGSEGPWTHRHGTGGWEGQGHQSCHGLGRACAVLRGEGAPPAVGLYSWAALAVLCGVGLARGPNRRGLKASRSQRPHEFMSSISKVRQGTTWEGEVRRQRPGQRPRPSPSFLPGSGSPTPAQGPGTCPVSPPSPPVAFTPKAPQPEADPPWSPGDLMEKEELVGRLARAIADGDEERAAQTAAALAQHHVALSVQLPESCFPPGPLRLQVTVEDAASAASTASSAHVSLQVHPHCTIAALQEQVFSEFGFPPAVQRWVIGRCLCVPERSLASYGVRQDGDPAFLYLLSAPREAPGCSPQRPLKTGGDTGHSFPQPLAPPRAQPASSSLPNPLQPGWPCPSCTFINALSRPGCEMCSTQRPCVWDPPPPAST